MTRFILAAALAAALAACSPPQQQAQVEPEAPPPPPNACAAEAKRDVVLGDKTYAVEVTTSGASCAEAVATLTVKTPEGDLIHNEALVAAQTFGLNAAADPKAMGEALAAMLDPGNLKTTGDLPVWKKGAESTEGEFPFIPEESLDQPAYEKLRAAKVPMLCYIQGGESYGCYRVEGAGMVKIGAQTFPG